MKFFYIVTVLLSFAGVSGINHVFENQPSSNEFVKGCVFVVFIFLISFALYKWFKHLKQSIYYKINNNTKKLNQQINYNRVDIEALKEKIIVTRQKLLNIGTIDDKVKEVAENNIALWEDQIGIHRKIISICDLRVSSLAQNKKELGLLIHLIKEMKKEPNAKKKLEKLQELINEIDGNVKLEINSEVDKLIRALKTDTRKKNIIHLKDRITQLELKVG